MGRPLFLEGEAGVGKTEIAKVLAATLGRRLIRLQCYEGLDVASAVYEWNYAAQMIAIRARRGRGRASTASGSSSDIFSERFLIKRPLLQALEPDPAGAPVLLIDELDRTDEAFEAFLLEVLADFQVTIPELGTDQGRAAADRHHHLEPHARDPRRAQAPLPLPLGRLSRRRARAGDRARQGAGRRQEAVAARSSPSCRRCASRICSSRRASPRRSTGRRRLTELDAVALDPATVSDTLGVLLKYQDDIARHRRRQGQGAARARCRRSCARRSIDVSADDRDRRIRERPPRREHRLFRARAARGRHAGRARARCSMRSRAVQAAGVGTREDFYWTLHAVFVKRHEHSRAVRPGVPHLLPQARAISNSCIAMLSPQVDRRAGAGRRAAGRRSACSEALFPGTASRPRARSSEIELDARFTVSDREVLQKKDFAQMTAAEIARGEGRDQARCVLPSTTSRRGGSRRIRAATASICAAPCAPA